MADIKDGVTLIADAIRKEIDEQEKAKQSVNVSNVIDVTAQFQNGNKVTPDKKDAPKDTPKDAPKDANGETDGTYPDGVPDATNKATNND